MMAKVPKNPKVKSSVRAKDVPATQAMLYLVRDELKADMKAMDHKLNGSMVAHRTEIELVRTELNAKIDGGRAETQLVRTDLKAEIQSVRAELKAEIEAVRIELGGKIDELRIEMAQFKAEIKSDIHRLALLIEEQNARNVFVLDGLAGPFHRQDRVEGEVIQLRREWTELKK